MPRIEPTDCTRTDASQHRPVLIDGLEKFVDAQLPPNAHHLQSVAATNVDDIGRQNLRPDLSFCELFLDEKQDLGFAFEEPAEVFLRALPVPFRIRTRSRHKKKLRMLFVR